MIPITETAYNSQYFESSINQNLYDEKTQRVSNIPFIFFKLEEIRELLSQADIFIEKEIAVDGFAELLSSQINQMNNVAYDNFLRWHMNHCETQELLKATNHFLFICKNK